MHYHAEVIIPPQVTDIEKAMGQVLDPFYEGEDGVSGFHDYWLIGGRWSGRKLMHNISEKQMESFYQELKDRKVTVSSIQAGKKTLQPSSQIPMVDALWKEMFGLSDVCPLFDHYRWKIEDEVGLVRDYKDMEPARVIIAEPGTGEGPYDYTNYNELEAAFMISNDFWNGVNFVDTTWQGSVEDAIMMFRNKIKSYAGFYRQVFDNLDDWKMVTIDYHS